MSGEPTPASNDEDGIPASRLLAYADWVAERTTDRAIIGSVVAYLVAQSVLALVLMPEFRDQTGHDVPDVQLGYSYAEIYAQIDAWGSAGVEFYRYFEAADVVFPLIYGTMLTLLISRVLLASDATGRVRMLVGVPAVAVVVDYFENLGIFLMLWRHPAGYEGIATVVSVLTILKYALIVVSGVIVLVGGAGLVSRKVKS